MHNFQNITHKARFAKSIIFGKILIFEDSCMVAMDRKIKTPKCILFFLIALISSVGLCVPLDENDVSGARNLVFSLCKYAMYLAKSLPIDKGKAIAAFAMVIALLCLYDMTGQKHGADKIRSAVFAAGFALMQMICTSLRQYNSLNAMAKSGYNLFRGAFIFVGMFVPCYLIIFLIGYNLYDRISASFMNGVDPGVSAKGGYHPGYISLTIKTLLFWLPYYILFFPGTSNYGDTEKQIRMFFHRKVGFPLNVSPVQGPDIFITDHHPFFTTWLYGSFVKLGLNLGKAWIGVAIFSFLQMVLWAAALSLIWYRLTRLRINDRYIRCGVWITRLFPFFPINAVCMVKDVTFSLFCLTTMLLLFELAVTGGEILKNRLYVAALTISVLLMILSKGQGKYFAAALLVVIFVVYRKYWKSVLVSFLLPILFYQFIWSGILLPMWNISPGGKQESIGFMLQQTARYVVEYKGEVTSGEAEVIGEVIDYANLEQLYDPRSTNPVKLTFDQQVTDEELHRYYLTWAAMFFKHPGVYVESVLNTSYGYFDMCEAANPFFTRFNSRVDKEDELYIESFFTNGRLGEMIDSLFLLLQRIPVAGLIFSPVFYTWLCIFLCIALVGRKNPGGIVVGILPFLSVLIYFICPRSIPRYSIPIIMVMPLMLVNTFYDENIRTQKTDKSEE